MRRVRRSRIGPARTAALVRFVCHRSESPEKSGPGDADIRLTAGLSDRLGRDPDEHRADTTRAHSARSGATIASPDELNEVPFRIVGRAFRIEEGGRGRNPPVRDQPFWGVSFTLGGGGELGWSQKAGGFRSHPRTVRRPVAKWTNASQLLSTDRSTQEGFGALQVRVHRVVIPTDVESVHEGVMSLDAQWHLHPVAFVVKLAPGEAGDGVRRQ